MKEEFLLEVFFLKLQKLLSTKVCDVEVELVLLTESSLPPQEMRERLKKGDRKMKIIFFIFQLITKSIKSMFVLGGHTSGTYQQIV